MSVLEDVLEEEYARSRRLLNLMEQEICLLPKGSIRMRNIKGHEYCYLNYRVGDKVKVTMSLLKRLMCCEPKSNAEGLLRPPSENRSNLKSKSYVRWGGCRMLTEQQRAFLKVLDLVEEAGCIDHVILIGSWAEFAYRQAISLPKCP